MARKNSKYSEDDIQVLGAIEGIRKRPTMYIGSTDSHGVFHIFKEVVDNAVDEFLAGRNSAVYISTDGISVSVGDDGQGIPTGIHKKTKRPTIETVFTENHAGGKFSDSAYDTSIGTHGVGITATNAMSEELEVWSQYTGAWQHISFKCGKVKQELHKSKPPTVGKAKPSGTIVRYSPDFSIFDKGAKLSIPLVKTWAEMTAYLNAGLKIEFFNENTEEHFVFKFKNGLDDLLDHLLKESENKQAGRIHINSKEFDLAISFLESDTYYSNSFYTNTSENSRGGSHEKLLWSSLLQIYKEHDDSNEFEEIDVQKGLISIFNVKLNQPRFSSQTKERLNDSRVNDYSKSLLAELKKFFKKQTELLERLIERAAAHYEVRTKSAIDKDLARKLKQSSKSGTLLPGKLVSAPKCKPEDRELFLVEGDSAGGSSIPARISVHTQEILKLKGKPINAARVETERYSANAEVFGILLALGYKPDAPDPYEELRVKNKIIFLTDPDVDGAHIALLLLVLLAQILPKLFKKRLVYVVDSPEYMTTVKNKRYYGNTKQELLKQLPKGSNPDIQHIKGWGEVSPQIMREVAFDPKTRKLICITAKKAEKIAEFLSLMSDDGPARKKLLGI